MIKRSVAREVEPEISIDPVVLTDKCSEKVMLMIKIDNKALVAELYVMDDQLIPQAVLLGTDILRQSGHRVVIEGQECRMERW